MKRTPLKPKGIKRGGMAATPLTRGSKLTLQQSKPKRRRKSPLSKLKAELWLLCRQLTKKKYGNTCYTCGREVPDGKGMHTGHYITSSLCSVALRYDLRNLRPQCYHDNINLSGNWPAYKARIEAEMGPEITHTLLKENERTKGLIYKEEWFHNLIQTYTKLLTIE